MTTANDLSVVSITTADDLTVVSTKTAGDLTNVSMTTATDLSVVLMITPCVLTVVCGAWLCLLLQRVFALGPAGQHLRTHQFVHTRQLLTGPATATRLRQLAKHALAQVIGQQLGRLHLGRFSLLLASCRALTRF